MGRKSIFDMLNPRNNKTVRDRLIGYLLGKKGNHFKVTDIGHCYSYYGNWSGLRGYKEMFEYGQNPCLSSKYKLIRTNFHDTCENRLLALIMDEQKNQVYIVDADYIEEVKE